MKCEHCNKNIDIDSIYCAHCGKEVKSFQRRVVVKTKTVFDQSVSLCKKRKWILPVTLGVIVALIIASVIANYEKKLDFTDYASFEISGYDGFGTLDIKIDYDKLAEAVLGKSPDSEVKKEYEKYVDYIKSKQELMQLFSVQVDKSENLKNGDFVLVTIYVENSSIFKDNKIAAPNEKYTKTFEIGTDTEKLTELTEIDLLKHITVEFSGQNGDGYATISNEEFDINITSNDGKQYTLTCRYNEPKYGEPNIEIRSSQTSDRYWMIKISLESNSNLSNGDTIKLILKHSEITFAEELGVKISTIEKEYTVSGLE